MRAADTSWRKTKVLVSVLLLQAVLFACSPVSPPSTIQPTRMPDAPSLPSLPPPATPPASTPTLVCTSGLAFVQDLSVPDGTRVSPGAVLDKQWLVLNSGSCNWSAGYRLRFMRGERMGAELEYALFPARAGAQAPLEIRFTAPALAGTYVSEWQAHDPNGLPFGDSFFIKVEVGP